MSTYETFELSYSLVLLSHVDSWKFYPRPHEFGKLHVRCAAQKSVSVRVLHLLVHLACRARSEGRVRIERNTIVDFCPFTILARATNKSFSKFLQC